MVKLASVELWVIAGCVLVSMVWPAALAAVVTIGVAYWLIRRFGIGAFSAKTPIDIGVLALVILIPLNLWVTASPATTLPQLLRLLSGIIFFYAIVNWARTTSRIRWLVFGTAGASFCLALFAMVSVRWTQQKLLFIPAAIYDRFILLVRDTIHHNVMAGSLVILLPISLGLLLFAWKELRRWQRALLTVVAVTVLTVLVLTQSRGALLALGAAIVLLISLRWRRGWVATPVSVVAAAGAVAYLGIERVLSILASGVSLEGLAGRLEVWSRALYMIRDFPITGIGMGMFGEVADHVYPFFLNAPGSVPHAHNMFLQVAVDVGIPGLIAWCAILVTVTVMATQLYIYGKRRSDRWTAGLAAGLLCSQVGLMVHGLLDAVTWGEVRSAPIVWAVWGLVTAAWIHSRRRPV